MNTKDPSIQNHDMKVLKKFFSPGRAIQFTFGKMGHDFLADKKFKHSIFMVLKSESGIHFKMQPVFMERPVKRFIGLESIDNRKSERLEKLEALASRKLGNCNKSASKDPETIEKELNDYL